MYDCTGRVALVTGASRGIGAAIAVRLAAAGATVAIAARTLDEDSGRAAGSLRATADAIDAVGGESFPVAVDLTDHDGRADVVPTVQSALGPIDVLVNNAGIAWYGNAEDLTRDRALQLMELDYFAPLELTLAALPTMRARGIGWIVNVSSVLAQHPGAAPYLDVRPMIRIGWHYGAVKAALERFTTGLASEVYEDRVAVNALLPAAGVRTAGFEEISSSVTPRPGLLEPVEQMAEATLALATGDPEVLTGRIVTSREVLDELQRSVHTLDGRAELGEPLGDAEWPPT